MSGHINLLIVSLEFNFNNIMEAVKSAEGREYTIADDKGPSTIILRSKKGLFITPAYVQELEKGQQIFGIASYLLQTRDGSLLIAGS
jgi:hypothetical protein